MTADAACGAAGAALVAEPGVTVTHVGALATAEAGAACFVEDKKALGTVGVPSLVFVTDALRGEAAGALPGAALAVTDRPKTAFAYLAARLHRSLLETLPPLGGIAEDARIAPSAQVAPSAVIGPGAEIGEDVVIGPHVLVGPGVRIHEGTRVGSHASITHAVIGRDCVFSAGARIGEAGFGYTPGEAGAVPVPQLGRVVIGDRVDIGANSTVDRGSLGDTLIGEGTKVDNLCQVGHNCRIGAHVLIASQTGVSGSVVIGDGVMIGGQAGMADHIEIGAGAVVTARSGLMKDVPPGERWGGFPARPARQWLKETAALTRLAGRKT